MTTTRLAAAVERPIGSSGSGDACAPHGPAVAQAPGSELSAAGQPGSASPLLGGLPRPCWGTGARQATVVQAQRVPGGHPWAWTHTSAAARGPKRTGAPAGKREPGRGHPIKRRVVA
ncbi:hypothetical protein [Nonomuraea angiospora]|uniref:hypothetical protein n=1 Tax=Nonomuraea angiospora TaxID=46172 RepID=UPI0029B39D11|nr:hypothetical protein [Nonomuraea angiospora]MDX3109701.1 hypothetical protein [Nonomuraea angiospora]